MSQTTPAHTEVNSSKPVILFVEDDVAYRDQVVKFLNNIPASVDVAGTGDEAVEILLSDEAQAKKYDLIILDMWVPRAKGDGVDRDFGKRFILDLQRDYGLGPESTPIIVHTGHESYEDCVECIRRGAIDYVPKTRSVAADGDEPAYPPVVHESGVETLVKRCSSLLTGGRNKKEESDKQWLSHNSATLSAKYEDRFVAWFDKELLHRALAKSEGDSLLRTAIEIEGRIVIAAGKWADVRNTVLRNPVLRWEIQGISYIEQSVEAG